MSKNDNKRGTDATLTTAIGAALAAAGATPDGPANAANIIEEMVEGQAQLLATRQAERDLYGPVECASADGNVSDRFGKKSCAAITVLVPIPSLGLKLTGTIWGRLVSLPTGTEIKFEAGMPKDLRAMDEAGKDRLLAHMEIGAQLWPGYEKTTDAVAAKLTGQTPKGINARPNLVKRVIMTGTAPTPQTPA